jgi:hypothetical protein
VAKCAVIDCQEESVEGYALCEDHEILENDDFYWPDFHDEAPDAWEDYSISGDSDLWDNDDLYRELPDDGWFPEAVEPF